ncbi:MAG: LLM class flavin-dependent oxidoreductase [Dehalococcoidia bacterium]
MRIGIASSLRPMPGGSWQDSVDNLRWVAQFADRHGYHALWMTEHHFFDQIGTGSPNLLLGHLAAFTTRLRLGVTVNLLPFHHPVRLAEDLLLLDQVSGGRLDIGIGRGHAPLEVAVLSRDADRSRELFDDGYQILAHAFTGEPFAFEGITTSLPRIQVFPGPVQRIDRAVPFSGPPFYMPITSPQSIAYAAEHGIIPLVGYSNPEQIAASVRNFEAAAAAAGVGEEQLTWALDRVATNRPVCVADSRDEAEEYIRSQSAYSRYTFEMCRLPVGDPGYTPEVPHLPPYDGPIDDRGGAIFGTRDDVVERIRDLGTLGVRQLAVAFGFYTPATVFRRQLERFTEEVMPLVSQNSLPHGGR